MRDFTKRQNPRRQVLRFFAGVAGILLLFFVTFGAVRAVWGMYGKFAEAAESDSEARQNLTELKAQEAQVSAAVEALSSSRGQEAQLRQSYGVALPGEGEIQIIEESASSTAEPAPQANILVRIWHAVFP
ncbi:MAG TPA: hypothetical protein VIJ88_00920 [Candidatus Paceibacterota bacterium]